jgi:outer membrane protein assembly factor BamB
VLEGAEFPFRAGAHPQTESQPAAGAGKAAVLLLVVIATMLTVSYVLATLRRTDTPNVRAQTLGGRMIWDDVGGPPLPAAIDGTEIVIGRLRAIDGGDQLFIVASDSATLATRWRAGPYGTYSEGYLSTYFVVAGERVIVSDFHSKLHFLDLKTGRELASLEMSDRAECISLDKNRVLVIQVDQKSLWVDPTNQTTNAVPPNERRRSWDVPSCARKSVERRSATEPRAPAVDGFEAYRVLVDGDDAVAAGKKAPGTPIPQVMGFEPKTKRALWRQTLPNVDPNTVDGGSALAGALGGHRYVGVYPVGTEMHRLTAFDARNGARLWDVKLRGIFAVDRIDDVVVTDQYVYAVRTSSLDVLDARTGRLVGAIGNDTYDNGE